MTALTETDWREWAAKHFEPKPRRWAKPGDLARTLDHKTADSPALQVIDRELVRLTGRQVPADGLMVFMPPQEGKSQRIARRFPLWLLAHDPTLRVAIVSYSDELATRWGRQLLRDIRSAPAEAGLNVRIMPDTQAAGRWDTPEGGGLFCTGIGGMLTGQKVDVLIIDDPVKDREQAESETYRQRTWDWWENVAIPRLGAGSIVVLVQTRWHEADLAGMILNKPPVLRWRVLSLPAIAGDRDPLGRAPGVEFPSVRGRDPGHFRKLQTNMTPYVFASIYQQNPTSVVGNFFRRPSFRYWRPADGKDPAQGLAHGAIAGAWLDCEGRRVDVADPATWRFATVDVAASTATASDWTVVSVWAIDRTGDMFLLDRRRAHIEMQDHFSMAKPLRDKWRFDVLFVERQFYSKTLVLDAQAAGIPVALVEADTDKITRAIPAASRVHAGRIWFPAVTSGCTCGACNGEWLEEWENELASFPRAAHDDQVDTLSYAARIIAAHWTPPAPPGKPARQVVPADLARINRAFDAATGGAPPGYSAAPDIMNMPLGLETGLMALFLASTGA